MTDISFKLIELEPKNYHILIEGSFGDGIVSDWIIDTGASKTVLDINLDDYYEVIDSDNEDDFQSAGINQGMIKTSVGKISQLKFGAIAISGLKVALIDLSHVNDIYCKYSNHRIAGLLGGDVLQHYKCVIDYGNQIISFKNPDW